MGRPPTTNSCDVERLAGLWVSDPSLRHIRDGESAVFEIQSEHDPLILRLSTESHRPSHQLEAELDFVEYLHDNGVNVARPVAAASGRRVVPFDNGEEPCFATAFRKVEGRCFQFFSDDINASLFRNWGKTMGRLHSLAQDYEPPPGLSRPLWHATELTAVRCPSSVSDPFLLTLADEMVEWLNAKQANGSFFGLVHSDFERTNFHLIEGGIAIFDFDDCVYHWNAWDIACSMWVFRMADQRSQFLEWFLEGYRQAYPVDERELQQFDTWIRLRTLCLILHRLREGDPEFDEWTERSKTWLRSDWTWR